MNLVSQVINFILSLLTKKGRADVGLGAHVDDEDSLRGVSLGILAGDVVGQRGLTHPTLEVIFRILVEALQRTLLFQTPYTLVPSSSFLAFLDPLYSFDPRLLQRFILAANFS